MSLHKIDDAKAFQMLRDLAMQKRVTVASLADGLVDSADLLTYKIKQFVITDSGNNAAHIARQYSLHD